MKKISVFKDKWLDALTRGTEEEFNSNLIKLDKIWVDEAQEINPSDFAKLKSKVSYKFI